MLTDVCIIAQFTQYFKLFVPIPPFKYVSETPQKQIHRFPDVACLADIRTETHLQFR